MSQVGGERGIMLTLDLSTSKHPSFPELELLMEDLVWHCISHTILHTALCTGRLSSRLITVSCSTGNPWKSNKSKLITLFELKIGSHVNKVN